MMPPAMSPADPTRDRGTRWVIWAALAGVVATFILRLPGMVEPLGPDQGVYTTIGWGLGRGLRLYRDLWEQKPPGIYLAYQLGLAIVGHHASVAFWLEYVAASVTIVFMFDAARRLVTPRFGALVALAVALGTMPAARFGYGGFLERAVTETFISPLAAAAFWATVIAVTQGRAGWFVAAGLSVGFAGVFKQTALIYWPALVAWTWFVGGARQARAAALLSLAGVVVAPAIVFWWLWSTGVLEDAWIALVQYNVAYLALGGVGPVGIAIRFAREIVRRLRGDEVWAFGSLSALAALLSWRWRTSPAGRAAALGLIWLAATQVAIVANGPRLFTTYFVPSLLPLCLLSAWLVDRTLFSGRRRRVIAGVIALVFAAAMVVRSGSVNRAVSMTRWDGRHLFGRLDRESYLQRFRSRASQAFSAADNERLAAHLRARTTPDERVFVFGMTASAYFMSERLPASRFLWAYPPVSRMIDRPEFKVETLAADLTRAAPRYIVLQRSNGDSFSGWRAADAFAAPALTETLLRYTREADIGDFAVYRRVDVTNGAADPR